MQLEGVVAEHPDLRFTMGGRTVFTFMVESHFLPKPLDCEAWGELADALSDTLTRGSRVRMDGYRRERQWADREGNRRSKRVYICQMVEIIGAPDPS